MYQSAANSTRDAQFGNKTSGGKWYFYNPATLSFGMSEFRKKWGKRKLEDDWRRKDKKISSGFETDSTAKDSTAAETQNTKDPKYYLDRLPKTKEDFKPLHLKRLFVFTPEEALEIMNEKLRRSIDWQTLDKFVPKLWRQEPQKRRAAIATSFAVSLEQARLKRVEIMQAEMFAPLYLRKVDQF